jgi:putative adhesin
MSTRVVWITLLVALLLQVTPAHGQETVTATFSDPSRPGLLKINILNGGIVVKGHSTNDVVVEMKGGGGRPKPRNTRSDGLRRIDSTGNALSVEENNNVITVAIRDFGRSGNLEIQVPLKTNLNLKALNGGDIVVEGVEGEIEVSNTNGGVVLNNVAGSVLAYSMNGRVLASLREIAANKPMALSSMNGSVDVTLPSNVKANLKMSSNNGEAYSDFDIQLSPNSSPANDTFRNRAGRGRGSVGKTLNGTINGGGPDFDLRTLNGNIYIRKAK